MLAGARNITIAGAFAYISCDAGLVVINLEDPLNPYVTAVIDEAAIPHPGAVQIQFRYAFVCGTDGLHVLDVTDLSQPRPVALLPLSDCRSVYVARTYAYVAAGHQGLVIVDITRPDKPAIDQIFDGGGCINDLNDVKLGITYTSQFAYLADGCNGLRIVQLTSPETLGNQGFSPRPTPMLIATRQMPRNGPALFVSEALDRDRAVDESGNQIAVFGRVGARPLSRDDQQRMYLRPAIGPDGRTIRQPWWVSDNPFDREVFRWTSDVPVPTTARSSRDQTWSR